MEKYLPDTEVKRILELEVKRQRETIDLIAAENYASKHGSAGFGFYQ
jgi:glycine/serine hydroxymethyltransferase